LPLPFLDHLLGKGVILGGAGFGLRLLRGQNLGVAGALGGCRPYLRRCGLRRLGGLLLGGQTLASAGGAAASTSLG
jgi:hypothetical protein